MCPLIKLAFLGGWVVLNPLQSPLWSWWWSSSHQWQSNPCTRVLEWVWHEAGSQGLRPFPIHAARWASTSSFEGSGLLLGSGGVINGRGPVVSLLLPTAFTAQHKSQNRSTSLSSPVHAWLSQGYDGCLNVSLSLSSTGNWRQLNYPTEHNGLMHLGTGAPCTRCFDTVFCP